MKASFEPQFDSQFNSVPVDSAALAYSAQDVDDLGARGCVVNRTHRVVRERATAMQAQRSRARSLVAPLIVCSVLLLLTGFAIWSGLDQYQAAEAAQADVSMLAATDVSNQLYAVLLWFVPVSITLLAIVLYRRSHKTSNAEALR